MNYWNIIIPLLLHRRLRILWCSISARRSVHNVQSTNRAQLRSCIRCCWLNVLCIRSISGLVIDFLSRSTQATRDSLAGWCIIQQRRAQEATRKSRNPRLNCKTHSPASPQFSFAKKLAATISGCPCKGTKRLFCNLQGCKARSCINIALMIVRKRDFCVSLGQKNFYELAFNSCWCCNCLLSDNKYVPNGPWAA